MKILSLGDLRCRQDLRYEARVYHEFVAVCICVSVAQPRTVQGLKLGTYDYASQANVE